MITLFSRHDSGFSAEVDAYYRVTLFSLFNAVADLLERDLPSDIDPLAALVGMSDDVVAPSDPALARMLPEASLDSDLGAEFRRFTDLGLRKRKAGALRAAAAVLRGEAEDALFDDAAHGPLTRELLERPPYVVLVDESCAQQWLTALADARLYMASRLEILDEADSERVTNVLKTEPQSAEEQTAYLEAELYEVLAALQQSLLEELLAELPEGP